MWPTKIHLKPKRVKEGILEEKKTEFSMLYHCGSFKRGFPDALVAEKKPCDFKMASWSMLQVQTLRRFGYGHLNKGL